MYGIFPKHGISTWLADGSFIETYDNPMHLYKVMIHIYSEDMKSTIYSKTYDLNSNQSTLVDIIQPTSSAVLFQIAPKIVITDMTNYEVTGRKEVLKLHIKFAENDYPIPITFSKSNRFSNRRAEFTMPLMSDHMEIHKV
jgi:hypothetical protein